MSLFTQFQHLVSNDIGIDLGTANTLVYVKGKGIVLNEPSIVAVNEKTGQVVAVGMQAKNMLGRTPAHITAIHPLVGGVISDFEVTQEMLVYLLNKSQKDNKKILGPRVVVGVPCGCTNVEIRAVRDAAKNAGASSVYILEEPMAAAIGIRLPVLEPVGSMIIDIGGGTSDIAVIALGGIVREKSLRLAGDKLNTDIIAYMRSEFKILIGEKTAEDIKIAIGTILPQDEALEAAIRGRDLITGLPREVIITDADIREALTPSIITLVEAVKEVLETTPPEIVGDVMKKGIYLVGGGALIRGLAEAIRASAHIDVHIAADPLTAVVRGTGIILDDIEKYRDVLIANENDLPPKK